MWEINHWVHVWYGGRNNHDLYMAATLLDSRLLYSPAIVCRVDGAQAVLEHAHKHLFSRPPAKTFVYAESMGGPLALSLITRPDVSVVVDGLILSGAASGLPDVLPPALVLAVVKQVTH